MIHLPVLLLLLSPVASYRHRRSSTESEETSHLTRKARLHSYDSIIADLTTDRTPEAIVEFTEIMNNGDLSREERNEKLDLWGAQNQCEDALGVFKIKEELIEEEEKKERIRKVDMLSSVAYQIREVMMDEEMTEYEKKEVIDNLAETAPEKIKPLLHALYPSLLKEQLSSDEIIGTPGQNFIDKVTDLNEILIDVLYQREELSLTKKREEIEGFIHNANTRVANVLRLLWPKIPRRRRHSRHLKLYDNSKHSHNQKLGRRPTKVPPYYNKDFS